MVLVAALAFLFAFMASGVVILPTLFNIIGFTACVWLAATALNAAHRQWRHRAPDQQQACANKVIPSRERRA